MWKRKKTTLCQIPVKLKAWNTSRRCDIFLKTDFQLQINSILEEKSKKISFKTWINLCRIKRFQNLVHFQILNSPIHKIQFGDLKINKGKIPWIWINLLTNRIKWPDLKHSKMTIMIEYLWRQTVVNRETFWFYFEFAS